MTHRRTEIRDAMVSALDAEPALTGKVSGMKVHPVQDADLPHLIVYCLGETSQLANHRRALSRTATIIVEIRTRATGDVGAAIDAIAETVEAALEVDFTFGGLALNSWLAATNIALDGDGDSRQAVAQLNYTVTYRT